MPISVDTIRDELRKARDLKLKATELEAQLKQASADIFQIEREVLPDMFNQAGVDEVGLPAEGNLPAYNCKLPPYFKANIAAGWPEERRMAALDYLTQNGAGSLIKTMINISLPLDSEAKRQELLSALSAMNIPFNVQLGVPWQTLTAWLREQSSNGKMVDLDTIGAQTGEVVSMKER